MEKNKINVKKNMIIIITAVVLAALITVGALFIAVELQGLAYDIESVPNVGSVLEIVTEDVDSVTVKKNGDGDFKVMMFTDTHLNGKEKLDNQAVSYIIKNITEQKPDLVIFGGDNISSGFSMARTEQFAEILEETGVYWCAVLGNHDGEGIMTYSRKKIVETFASYEHCLMKPGKEDIDGYGNYTINILNSDGSLKEVLFFMDSGDYITDELREKYNVPENASHYDGVKESQVQWYKEKHDAIENEYGEFKSITVIHIPPYQSGLIADMEYLYGDKREGICPSGFDSGLFDALKEKGSTQAVYYGHDHINDFGVVYDGILLSYIQSSGYSSYNMQTSFGSPESEWIQGCTVLLLNDDGTYEAQRILNHAAD